MSTVAIGGDAAFRAEVLRAHGAAQDDLPQLLAYTANPFGDVASVRLPLPDEAHVAAWEGYLKAAERDGVFNALRERLVQLRFPIRAGISATAAYQAATRRGVVPPGPGTLELRDPAGLRLFIQPTPAGRVPAILASDRADFVALIQALTGRNEPVPVPDSVGATIVGGYNNWDRVGALRQCWQEEHPAAPASDWTAAFRELVPRKELYQDRFILLSSGPYSATPADALGLAQEEWRGASVRLRLEHECAHYVTRRAYGSMKNLLFDELLADYYGIVAVAGRFRADWFLRFLGLEAYPAYRPSGRLQQYRGDPPLPPSGFRVLQSLVHAAAQGLEAWDRARDDGRRPRTDRASALATLAGLSLEALAAGVVISSPGAASAPVSGVAQ